MPTLSLPNNWAPRGYQKPLWNHLESGGKRAISIWHRRAGKDEVALHWTACAAMQRPGNYWHCLPTYAQSRKAIWSAVNGHTGKRRIDEAFPKEIRAATNEQEMFIRFVNGSTWTVVGSDTYDNLVGAPPVGIVFSEWSRANPAAWAYMSPILSENDGWAVFITTPQGNNHAKSMYDMAMDASFWFAEKLTVTDTNAIPLVRVEEDRLSYRALFGDSVADALVEQEYYCSFNAATPGAYYTTELLRAERENRLTHVEVNPDWPIHTAWDLGVDDPTAIWVFQCGDGRVNVIDYFEGSGQGLKFYTDWLADNSYRGGVDWVPHDAKIREMGDSVTPRTRIQNLIGLGRNPRVVPDHSLMDGINAGRQTLPKSFFDAGRCSRGLECLRSYQAEWDDDLRTFKRSPLHNWASHAADAWRYLSVAWREPVNEETMLQRRERKYKELIADLKKKPTLNDWIEEWEREQADV